MGKPVKFSVELPLPPKQCSPNYSSKHWGGKAQARNFYRALCGTHFKNAMRSNRLPALKKPITIHLEYYLYRPTEKKDGKMRAYAGKKWFFPQDEDNARAGAKTAQDALQDAGYIFRDSSDYVRAGTTVLRTKAGKIENGGHGFKSCLVMIFEGELADES